MKQALETTEFWWWFPKSVIKPVAYQFRVWLASPYLLPPNRRRIAALCPDDSGAELRHHGLYSLALLRKSEVLKSSGARKSLFTGWPVRYVEQSSFHQP